MKLFCQKCNTLVYKTQEKTPNWKNPSPYRLGAGCQLIEQSGDVPHVRCRCGLLIVLLKAGNA